MHPSSTFTSIAPVLIGFLTEYSGPKQEQIIEKPIYLDPILKRISIGSWHKCNHIIGQGFDKETRGYISKIQATITFDGETPFIWDGALEGMLGPNEPAKRSANGVYLDPHKIENPTELKDNLVITLFRQYPCKVVLHIRNENSERSGGLKETYTPQFILEQLQETVGQFKELVPLQQTQIDALILQGKQQAEWREARQKADEDRQKADLEREKIDKEHSDSIAKLRLITNRLIAGVLITNAIILLGFLLAGKEISDKNQEKILNTLQIVVILVSGGVGGKLAIEKAKES